MMERLLGRILIVEDDPPQRRTISKHLTKQGHVVLGVESAEAALNAIHGFAPDLVISDVRMAGLSGFELLDRIGEQPDFDVVLIENY